MMPGFLYANKHKKKKKKKRTIKLNFQKNWLITRNLTSELCIMGKDKFICTVQNIILN